MCSSTSPDRAHAVSVAAVLAVTLHAMPTWACSVCMGATGSRVLYTYFFTAAAMTALALGMVAGLAGWLYRRFRDADAQVEEGDG